MLKYCCLNNCVVFIQTHVMQRISRLKREMQLLSAEPPPGVSCWQTEGRVDELQARQSAFIWYYMQYQSKPWMLTASSPLHYSCVWYRDRWRCKYSLWRRCVHTGNQHTWEVRLLYTLVILMVKAICATFFNGSVVLYFSSILFCSVLFYILIWFNDRKWYSPLKKAWFISL